MLCGVLKGDDALSWPADFNFREDALDSLDLVTLALLIEEATGLKIADQELGEMTSIAKVMAYLKARA
jgi:acyl carrier protein